jgi:hypothetical protein
LAAKVTATESTAAHAGLGGAAQVAFPDTNFVCPASEKACQVMEKGLRVSWKEYPVTEKAIGVLGDAC